ncbi:MAG: hypothetical protein ACWGO1_06950 [Anaerolineales bacterium]
MSEEEHAEETTEASEQQPAEFEELDSQDQAVSDDEEQDSQEQVDSSGSPALVINVHSWATPIVGLLMLVVGLLVGYLVHPMISASIPAETAVAVAPANTPVPGTQAPESQVPAGDSTQPPASLQEVMEFLESEARHVKGDSQAAVTMVEFSDFQ